jgi:hypothetical protein
MHWSIWYRDRSQFCNFTKHSVAFSPRRTVPTDRPLIVEESSASFCGQRMSRVQRNRSLPEPLLFIQVAPQLSSRRWIDPVPNPPLLRKSASAGNSIRDLWLCSHKLWPLAYRGGQFHEILFVLYVHMPMDNLLNEITAKIISILRPDNTEREKKPNLSSHHEEEYFSNQYLFW